MKTVLVEQVKAESPSHLHYAPFHLSDGLSSVHLAAIETPDGSNPPAALSAFKAFTAGIKDRCDEPPVATDLTAVGAYRVFTA